MYKDKRRNGMASWKLSVENYGKIKSAEIEVAPLTLFVGDNNSGKSYLLALLWGIEKFGVEALIGENYISTVETTELTNWVYKQIEVTIKNKSHKISLGEITPLLNNFLNIRLRKNKDNLVKKIFNSRSVEIGKMEIKLQNLDEKFLYFEMDENNRCFSILNGISGSITLGETLITDKKYKELDDLQWYIIQEIYSVALNVGISEEMINGCIYLPVARFSSNIK